MEDAKITEEKQQPTGMPSLITEDDLQLELGRWVVTSLNKDKIIVQMGAKISQLVKARQDQKAEIDKVPAIERSNRQLDEKNRALAESITELRSERDKAVREAARMGEKLEKAEASLVECQEELDRLKGLYDRCKKRAAKKKVSKGKVG